MITNTSNGATLELTQNLHQQVAIPVQSIQAIGKALTQQNISDFFRKKTISNLLEIMKHANYAKHANHANTTNIK